MSHVWYKLQMDSCVPLKEKRSLKTFFVLKILLSQMRSNGYGTAVPAPATSLIWAEDRSAPWPTANWILNRAGEIFLGLPLDFFPPYAAGSYKKLKMTVLLCRTSAAMAPWERPCSTIRHRLHRESFLTFTIRRSAIEMSGSSYVWKEQRCVYSQQCWRCVIKFQFFFLDSDPFYNWHIWRKDPIFSMNCSLWSFHRVTGKTSTLCWRSQR